MTREINSTDITTMLGTGFSGLLKAVAGVATVAVPGTDYLTPAGLTSALASYSPLAGSTSLTTVGTIGTGSWAGTAIPIAYGGTGSTTAPAALAALGAAANSVFGASGTGHATGLVPDPGSSAGSSRFLREDATWQTVSGGGGGTVTSVALTVPGGLSVSGSPVTGSGTLAVTTTLSGLIKGTGSGFTTATAGTDYLAPAGSGSALTGITYTQVSGLGTAATASSSSFAPASGSTGVTTLGTVTTGTWTGTTIAVANGGTGATSASAALTALGAAANTVFGASGSGHSTGLVPDPGATAGSTRYLREDGTWQAVSGGGGGTVTSVALTVPTGLSVSGSPVTASGTLAITTALSGLVKGTGSGFAAATAGTDYALPNASTTGSAGSLSTTIASGSLWGGQGSGIPSAVTVGSGLSLSGGTLSATGGGGMSIGGSVTSGTANSLLYLGTGGVLAQDNTNLTWNDSTKALTVGSGGSLNVYDASFPISIGVSGSSGGLSVKGTQLLSGDGGSAYYNVPASGTNFFMVNNVWCAYVNTGGLFIAKGHIQATTPAPTVTVGSAAGTGATAVVSSGNDSACVITLTTGTSPAANGTLFTITFNSSWTAMPNGVSPSALNPAAAGYLTSVYEDITSRTSSVAVFKNVAAPAASTVYKFQIEAGG